jgi:hypothetical protein
MKEIKQTPVFKEWLNGLKDFKTVKVVGREIETAKKLKEEIETRT